METVEKTTAREDDQRPQQQDPPVIVGGGGSVYVWIKKTTMPQLVDPKTGIGKPPGNPNAYHCFKCDANIKNITVEDGKGHTVKPPSTVDKDKHFTVFDDV